MININKYKLFKTEIILLLLSVLCVAVSYSISAEFFARSGSIMVLFSVIIEYRLLSAQNIHIDRKVKTAVYSGKPTNIKNTKEHKNMSIIAHIFVVLGTLIWGYGDLIK